ncbi:MAG: YcnI family protein [Candidatus Saccharibacteria bacterium]|nr:YcnI family protein [Candidatus Saccharibacteria bacterium]
MTKHFGKGVSLASGIIGLAAVFMGATVSAHVVVKPGEVVTAGFQTFTIGVPNEKDISTTKVNLVIPEGLKYVQPTQKAGWKIDIEKTGTGEDATVTSITWSGNEVKAGFRDEFTFSGQVPENATELQWKAYQTYADGTVVSWDKASEGGHDEEGGNSGPYSVTKVVAETAANMAVQEADEAADDAKSAANTALYVGVAGLATGLAGVYLGTRKK